MLCIKDLIKDLKKEKEPNYAKAIVLTAITVAAVETAAIIACKVIRTKILEKKAAAHLDNGFDISIDDGECEVSFEAEA